MPDNIELFFLPPYSPELNPVERFWQHIKSNTIKNKIYENLANLEKKISTFLKGITREVTASVCAVNYL
ncbi:MAG: transposase [Alphaproteobacteria bacterium]|nr:transposase [Alphaproteobacteria bacterium]